MMIGIALVVFGVLMIVGAFVGKEFHAADVLALGEHAQKASKWSGKVVFALVGVGLLIVGLKLLFFSE